MRLALPSVKTSYIVNGGSLVRCVRGITPTFEPAKMTLTCCSADSRAQFRDVFVSLAGGHYFVHDCRFEDPPPVAAASAEDVAGMESHAFGMEDGKLADLLVKTMHQGLRLPADTRDSLSAVLQLYGYGFKRHRLWKHVSTQAPHDGVIRRLARAIGATVPALETIYGYANRAAFVDELDGLIAWYSVVRGNAEWTESLVAERTAALLGGAVGLGVVDSDEEKDVSEGGELFDASVVRDGEGGVGSNVPPEAVAQAAAGTGDGKSFTGITLLSAIAEAVRLVKDDVVVQGLLANQKLVGIMKGAGPSFSVHLDRVTDRLLVPTGTCPNEAAHEHLNRMIIAKSISIDMMEVRGCCQRFCWVVCKGVPVASDDTWLLSHHV
jgi:hypothetical protein